MENSSSQKLRLESPKLISLLCWVAVAILKGCYYPFMLHKVPLWQRNAVNPIVAFELGLKIPDVFLLSEALPLAS